MRKPFCIPKRPAQKLYYQNICPSLPAIRIIFNIQRLIKQIGKEQKRLSTKNPKEN